MALLFMDGFDHMTASSAILLTKWASSAGGAACQASAARTGTAGLNITSTAGDLVSKPFAASGGAIIGLAFRTTAFTSAVDLIQVREGSTVHVAVGVNTSAHLEIKRGSTVLATGATTLAINNFYYIELKTVIHDTAGTYEVRIDTVPELGPATSQDTRNVGTTGQWDRIRVGSPSSNTAIDDLYVCDTSGAAPLNTFLGICKVETLLPQTGNGTNAGLTPSTGTDHGALVDENPPNTSDYNGSPTVGLKDTYNYPSLTLTGTILGIQTNLYVNKSDAVARQVCAVVRTGSTDYDGANVAPTTTFGYFSEVRALNPNTGVAWTSTNIDALEAGMKVTA